MHYSQEFIDNLAFVVLSWRIAVGILASTLGVLAALDEIDPCIVEAGTGQLVDTNHFVVPALIEVPRDNDGVALGVVVHVLQHLVDTGRSSLSVAALVTEYGSVG